MEKNKMTSKELEEFLTRHDIQNKDFAHRLGVTTQAVEHWLFGRREIPETTVKLLRLFDKYPSLIEEFV